MRIHERYGLRQVINASGSFTPLGVSRSSEVVAGAAAQALREFLVIDELQDMLSEVVARRTGAQAAAACHCAAAGITLCVAAAMTHGRPDAVQALPNVAGLRHRAVLPAAHSVNYGHPITTDIRLAGAQPVLAGTADGCTQEALRAALADENTACLLVVSSRLTTGSPLDLHAAVRLAHERGVPAIIDAAAQDMRMQTLLDTGADAVVFSAQKYLAAPTVGLVVGTRPFVEAFRAQERGIGRAMKATKEAIVGLLAAMDERDHIDVGEWRAAQLSKVDAFVQRANRIGGLAAVAAPDPAGMPFSRVHLRLEGNEPARSAARLVSSLQAGSPSIWVMQHALADGELVLELVALEQADLEVVLSRLHSALGDRPAPAQQQ